MFAESNSLAYRIIIQVIVQNALYISAIFSSDKFEENAISLNKAHHCFIKEKPYFARAHVSLIKRMNGIRGGVTEILLDSLRITER